MFAACPAGVACCWQSSLHQTGQPLPTVRSHHGFAVTMGTRLMQGLKCQAGCSDHALCLVHCVYHTGLGQHCRRQPAARLVWCAACIMLLHVHTLTIQVYRVILAASSTCMMHAMLAARKYALMVLYS